MHFSLRLPRAPAGSQRRHHPVAQVLALGACLPVLTLTMNLTQILILAPNMTLTLTLTPILILAIILTLALTSALTLTLALMRF